MAVRIFSPRKYDKLFLSDYNKAIIIIEIFIILLIATAPSIVGIGLSKYGIVTFPPIQCGCTDRVYLFYTTVLQIVFGVLLCGILMLFIVYKIHMVR